MNTLVQTVSCITVISYLIGMACKAIDRIPDKFIPVIVGIAGGILGVVGLYTVIDYPAVDILNAIAVGIASGLASTGVNQIVKQLRQENVNE